MNYREQGARDEYDDELIARQLHNFIELCMWKQGVWGIMRYLCVNA